MPLSTESVLRVQRVLARNCETKRKESPYAATGITNERSVFLSGNEVWESDHFLAAHVNYPANQKRGSPG